MRNVKFVNTSTNATTVQVVSQEYPPTITRILPKEIDINNLSIAIMNRLATFC